VPKVRLVELAARVPATGGHFEDRFANRHWRKSMRSLVAMMIVVAVATPAGAQLSPNIMQDMPKLKTDVEVKQEQERESGYKAGLSKIPDQKAKTDPWGTVRGSEAPQSNQKPQRPGSK
jgi:hypothetical protein